MSLLAGVERSCTPGENVVVEDSQREIAGCTRRACRQEEETTQGASPGQAKTHQKLMQTQKAEDEVIPFAQRKVRSRKLALLLLPRVLQESQEDAAPVLSPMERK